MAHSPECTARLFHFSHYARLIARLLEWLIDHLEIHRRSALKFFGSYNNNKKKAFVKRQLFICHICSTWFIDVNGMQIKLPNDLVTCLFWFAVHHLLCGAKRDDVFIGSENELRCILRKPYFGDKMMDVILIFKPICTAMHGWYRNCFSCYLLMLLSRHHR